MLNVANEELINLHAAALVVERSTAEIQLELWKQRAYVHGDDISMFVSYEDLEAAKELVSTWYEH